VRLAVVLARHYAHGDPGEQAARLKEVIAELAQAKFAGHPRSFDRAALRQQLSYGKRAVEFAAVNRTAIERRQGGRLRSGTTAG
jgi:hypothetical protein